MMRFSLPVVAAMLIACSSDVAQQPSGGGSTAGGAGATATGGQGGAQGGQGGAQGGQGGHGAQGGQGGQGAQAGQGGAGATMILEPTTMEFFELPIGSIRWAVTGQDQASNTCVALIWMINQPGAQQVCTDGGMQNWPYVVITPGAQAPCMQWEYGGNVNVDAATGCVDFDGMFPLSAAIDVTVDVSGGPFTGTIIADNIP